jgi:4-hydroxythreonine-4-phosphate dehydrogenase
MSQTVTPRIALTAGEPAGIGPDLCVQLVQQAHAAEITLIADPDLLQQRAGQLGLPLQIELVETNREDAALNNRQARPQQPGVAKVLPVKLAVPARAGELNADNATYVLKTLQLATDKTVSGEFSALVTGPVHKGIINEAGIAFTGHTEYLAQHTRAVLPVMMLQTESLRVALVTTHMPLASVSAAITASLLEQVIRILAQDMTQQFGIDKPDIYVCGLNPHAGEHGHLGREEIDVIEPVLQQLRSEGLQLTGPLSADTIFSEKNRRDADVFLAMYHDQGLPVLKTLGFGEAINVTLGLPIVRTSVDHGTALELAGTGLAEKRSLELAIQTAIQICANRQRLM